MAQYTEKTKNTARESVLTAAISALTKNRTESTLAKKNYVRNVRDKLVSRNDAYSAYAARLTDETLSRWESFYSSIIKEKSPEELKIAYLSGPNPENDLREMTKLGVLPENIWAFETDKKVYNEAVVSALASEFPYIKLIKSNISGFLEISPQKFDIIYLDFCGPLPSQNKKQKTLKSIADILRLHSINSPGALITNVSLPTESQNQKSLDMIKKLVAIYLYPKQFLETGCKDHNLTEGAEAHGHDFDEWLEIVSSDIENYYGQYITRLLMDMIGIFTPYDNFPSNHSIFENMFNIDEQKEKFRKSVDALLHFNEDSVDEEYGGGGGVICDRDMFASLWSTVSLSKDLNKENSGYPQDIYSDVDFAKYASNFLSQLSSISSEKSLSWNIAETSYLLSEGNGEEMFYSKAMEKLEEINWFNNYPIFCDVFMLHQIKEVLFRQISVPYHVNIESTKRWRYKAKETPMYMDLFILDECRYLYDWMPTIDMIHSTLHDVERQLSFRFALDALSKHRRYYNTEFFFGTASVGENNKGFEAKLLEPRIGIK